ncbi:MAG: alpha/beta fold hydrolase [Deltaproteobacteria bacterium]|nr:alpha/beta fold hydrolase [Deltaproteobacteria bacterium]
MLHPSQPPKISTTVRSKTALRFARAALQTAYILSENLGSGLAERLFTSPKRYARPDREKAILASARRFEVDVHLRSPRWNGARTPVTCWRWGVGPAVLLVHGWEGRGSQLGAFVEPLVAAGLSVVTFDAPGHGSSPGNRLYLTDLADAIIDVAAAVGPLHGLVAHSFGAAASLLAYARGGVDAARNVMISPNVIIEDSVRKFARMVALDEGDRTSLEDNLAQATGIGIESLRLDNLVGSRDASLLVIHDRDDREVPAVHGERLAEQWGNAALELTEGLGHRKILRTRAVIAKVVESVRVGVPLPPSDLVRELDRLLDSSPTR